MGHMGFMCHRAIILNILTVLDQDPISHQMLRQCRPNAQQRVVAPKNMVICSAFMTSENDRATAMEHIG